MSFKTILVHIDSGKRCPVRLDVAIDLAKRFGAHLVGLHALTAVRLPAYAVAETGQTIADMHRRILTEHAKQVETQFRRAVDKAGVTNAEWRSSFDDAVEAVTLNARYADLVIIGQPEDESDSGVEPGFAHELILKVGRPVLVVPYIGAIRTLGKRIMLAWNGGREATRAVTDALPFLRAAEEVTVVAVNPGATHGEEPGADIALYLARHGVRVKVAAVKVTDIDPGNELLSRAADHSADLIVMGAYGHSRLTELVLGGVTRTMFASMTVPVLMSH